MTPTTTATTRCVCCRVVWECRVSSHKCYMSHRCRMVHKPCGRPPTTPTAPTHKLQRQHPHCLLTNTFKLSDLGAADVDLPKKFFFVFSRESTVYLNRHRPTQTHTQDPNAHPYEMALKHVLAALALTVGMHGVSANLNLNLTQFQDVFWLTSNVTTQFELPPTLVTYSWYGNIM